MQPDPAGYKQDINLYTYCVNDPVNILDPDGMESDEFDYSSVPIDGKAGIFGPGLEYLAQPPGAVTADAMNHAVAACGDEIGAAAGRAILKGAMATDLYLASVGHARNAVGKLAEHVVDRMELRKGWEIIARNVTVYARGI